MNLQPLLETKKILDDRIVKEKGLEGHDLLPEKILALQVELGELANEWRGFKFWSKDREPRTTSKCVHCDGDGRYPTYEHKCQLCKGTGLGAKNPLLEEYVDCLHFLLSIGLEIGIDAEREFRAHISLSVTQQFNILFIDIGEFHLSIEELYGLDETLQSYDESFYSFIGLGEMLGFTWEQIEKAYYAKNQINHTRQESGY